MKPTRGLAREWRDALSQQHVTLGQGRARRDPALSPSTIEAIRSDLLAADRARDATLVSILAYAGLRPGEALALRWGDVRERTLIVERALALGEIKVTKTGAVRAVRLLRPLAREFADWRAASAATVWVPRTRCDRVRVGAGTIGG